MEWIALAISVAAFVMAFFADQRSRKTFRRESKEALRKEVEFKVTSATRSHGSVNVTLANFGTETPRAVTVDPASIQRVAWEGFGVWLTVPPQEPIELRYSEGISPLQSITLNWTGPGTGKQSIIIPKIDPEVD